MEYISVAHQKALGHSLRLANLIVLAFIATIVIYLIVARFLNAPEVVPGSEQWVKPIYAGVLILSLGVVILRRVWLARLTTQAKAVSTVLSNLTTLAIIAAAVAEVIAIAGLLAYLLTGEYHYSWRLGGIGLLLLIYSLPRRWEWERAVIASAKGSA